jgi:NTE family protein
LKIILQERIDFPYLMENTSLQLFLCATNVKSGKLKVFEKSAITLDAVLASACLPHLSHAVKIDDEYYWDGGYIGNPPIFPLIYKSKIDDIIIVHNNPIVRDSLPFTTHEIDNRINEITFNSSLIRELRAMHFVTDLITNGMIKSEFKDHVRLKLVHMIRSDAVMSQFSLIDKYKWHLEFLLKLRDLGRKIAGEWLENNYKDIGIRSTIDFSEFI